MLAESSALGHPFVHGQEVSWTLWRLPRKSHPPPNSRHILTLHCCGISLARCTLPRVDSEGLYIQLIPPHSPVRGIPGRGTQGCRICLRTRPCGCDHSRGSGSGLGSGYGRSRELGDLLQTGIRRSLKEVRSPPCDQYRELRRPSNAVHSPTSLPHCRNHCLGSSGTDCSCTAFVAVVVGCRHRPSSPSPYTGVSEKVLSTPQGCAKSASWCQCARKTYSCERAESINT